MKTFTSISPAEMGGNPFHRIGTDWMLITAGDENSANRMTASWGGLGVLWNKPVVFAFVRPTRYTYEFLEREDTFSLSFFPDESTRQALTLCGRVSGRDTDKIADAGLTLRTDAESPFFDEADSVPMTLLVYDVLMALEQEGNLRRRTDRLPGAREGLDAPKTCFWLEA